MATRNVRFEFICDDKLVIHTHTLPSILIHPDPTISTKDAQYAQLFMDTIRGVMDQHREECRLLLAPTCGKCSGPATFAFMRPFCKLEDFMDPHVRIFVSPLCFAGSACHTDVLRRNDESLKGTDCEAIKVCVVCQRVDGLSRCGGCSAFYYCGKVCQRAHWPEHKKICVPEKKADEKKAAEQKADEQQDDDEKVDDKKADDKKANKKAAEKTDEKK